MGVFKWIASLVVVVAIAVAGLYVYVMRSLQGPPTPICKGVVPPRRTFERPVQISSRTSPGARRYDVEPRAALLPDGSLAIVYNPRDTFTAGKSGLATAVVSPDGKVAISEYSTDRAEAFDAWMTADPTGRLHMVWLGHDGGRPEKNMKVGYATSTDGRTWSRPRAADAPKDCPDGQRGCLDKPMVAASRSRVFVAYHSQPCGGLCVASGDLADPRFETSTKVGDGAYGDLVATSSGAVHLVWVGDAAEPEQHHDPYGDPRNGVFYASSADGGETFSGRLRVSGPTESIPFYFSNPQVAVDEARGLVYVVYPAGTPDGAWDIRLATSKDRGQTFERVQVNDDAHCASHMTPHVALDPKTGEVHVTWLDNRNADGELAYAVCAPGGERCSANEAVSDRPFASYAFERHLATWLGEYGSLVLDAERRVLWAVWTQPVDERGEAISRIFYARAPLR